MARGFWQEDQSKRDWSSISKYVNSTTKEMSFFKFFEHCQDIAEQDYRTGRETTFFRDCIHRLLGDSTLPRWDGVSRDLHMDVISYYFPEFWGMFMKTHTESIDTRIAKENWKLKARLGLVASSNARMPYRKAITEYQKQYENIHTNWNYLIKSSMKRVDKIKQNEAISQGTNIVKPA